ncbi:MAG TPA: hypothetical protein VK629_15445 [Steroidobacteraceae bacterium]|nr:hypothetical protein [Steroidobacteraceae bacterium]
MLKVATIWPGGWLLAVLLDPDHGVMPQGKHMYIVGPVVLLLIFASPVVGIRWLRERYSSKNA